MAKHGEHPLHRKISLCHPQINQINFDLIEMDGVDLNLFDKNNLSLESPWIRQWLVVRLLVEVSTIAYYIMNDIHRGCHSIVGESTSIWVHKTILVPAVLRT